jgi:hypothetical protein
MSCGNRFECALRKNSRLSTQSDRPSNLELYNENQKRLNDLIKAREEIDNHFFRPISSGPLESQKVNTQSIDCLLHESITVDDVEINNSLTTKDTSTFTPWVVPSTKNYSTN